MRFSWRTFCFATIMLGISTSWASFLHVADFPKTIDDLSLTDRMALKKGDYEQYESEYDANGNCISGCSYALPKWEDELAAMERVNELSRQELISQHNYTQNPDGTLSPPPADPIRPVQVQVPYPSTGTTPPTIPYQPPSQSPSQQPSQSTPPSMSPSTVPGASCTNRNTGFENRGIPYKNPLGQVTCITSPYGPRDLFGRKFHYGMDFRAKIGTPVYSPANGTVKLIFLNNKTCGNGIVIEHSSGYSTKYCHMDSVAVKKGDKVAAGCFIGKSGNTGPSTGPHLHYSVLKDGNAVNPADFLEPGHKSCY